MIKRIDLETKHVLYDYFNELNKTIPFYFPVDYNIWHKSMFNDETEEGKPLFSELETYLYSKLI
jgi:hypothetical protein